ncbi:MAG: hypothetical protein L0Y38_06100 [Methylococcaceae bacterium]|nr:hypothetical protein [Methylococcaceae bacterium]MCI0666637.1 hypothetical protein [Methylococcaceae bacterium]MCI0733378.1 hypothetical protein [Methylococcaceae bacterium]
MNFLRLSWWLTPVISFYWVRARDLSVRSKFDKTLSCLKWIRRMRGADIRPLGQWTTEYYITQGHAQYELGQMDAARQSFTGAFRELKKADIYTRMEKSYLALYMLTTHPSLNLESQDTTDIQEINLDKIEPDLRNYYPLRAHPEWE